MKIIVNRTYTIEFDGTMEQYIDLAECIVDDGLDSHDCGDATGAYIDQANRDWTTPGMAVFNDAPTRPWLGQAGSNTAIVTFEDDSFIYEGEWSDGN